VAWSMSTNPNYPLSLAICFYIGRYPRPSTSYPSYFKKLTTSWDGFVLTLARIRRFKQLSKRDVGGDRPSFSALPTMFTITSDTSETFQSEEKLPLWL